MGAANLELFPCRLATSKPIIAVMVLFYAVGHWNSYFDALIFLFIRGILSGCNLC
jgi:putative aldouronate transport system permease protein